MTIELFIHVNSVYLHLFKYNVLIIIRTVIKSDALAIARTIMLLWYSYSLIQQHNRDSFAISDYLYSHLAKAMFVGHVCCFRTTRTTIEKTVVKGFLEMISL